MCWSINHHALQVIQVLNKLAALYIVEEGIDILYRCILYIVYIQYCSTIIRTYMCTNTHTYVQYAYMQLHLLYR
jgi:hypothetical protein